MVGQILPMLAVLTPYPAAIAESLATDDLSTKRSAVVPSAGTLVTAGAACANHGPAVDRRKLTDGKKVLLNIIMPTSQRTCLYKPPRAGHRSILVTNTRCRHGSTVLLSGDQYFSDE